VPAERKRSRDLLVARVVVDTLERMEPKFPKVPPEVLEIARQWEREATVGGGSTSKDYRVRMCRM
jgi:hypothetical protein